MVRVSLSAAKHRLKNPRIRIIKNFSFCISYPLFAYLLPEIVVFHFGILTKKVYHRKPEVSSGIKLSLQKATRTWWVG